MCDTVHAAAGQVPLVNRNQVGSLLGTCGLKSWQSSLKRRCRSHDGVCCVLLLLQVGLLSSQTRLVRIKNALTEQQDTVEVPMEETLLQV